MAASQALEFVAAVYGHDTTCQVVVVTALKAGVFHHRLQRRLVGMHAYGFGQVAIAGCIPGNQLAKFWQTWLHTTIVSTLSPSA